MKQIKITQIKSAIGYRERTKQTLTALGLKKMNQSVLYFLQEESTGVGLALADAIKKK